jgi:hypothetical protein
LAYENLVTVFQGGLIIDFDVVDEHSVFALHVERIMLLFVFVKENLHVLAGNVLIENLD